MLLADSVSWRGLWRSRAAQRRHTRGHCGRIGPAPAPGPYGAAGPAQPIHSACAAALPRRPEKCCKYPRVRCRGEGFSAPPIASGCSQALFQRGCFSGRALGLLAQGSNPTRRAWFRFQLLPLETAVNGGESSSRARYPAPKWGDVALYNCSLQKCIAQNS